MAGASDRPTPRAVGLLAAGQYVGGQADLKQRDGRWEPVQKHPENLSLFCLSPFLHFSVTTEMALIILFSVHVRTHTPLPMSISILI